MFTKIQVLNRDVNEILILKLKLKSVTKYADADMIINVPIVIQQISLDTIFKIPKIKV